MPKTFTKKSPLDDYRQKITAVLKKLPEHWRAEFFKRFPKYNTATGKTFIENIVVHKSSDTAVLECLTKLAKSLARKKKKGAANVTG